MNSEKQKYYILYENAVYGPYIDKEMEAFLTHKTLVCKEGEESWHTAADIPELKTILEANLHKNEFSDEKIQAPGNAYFVYIDNKEYGPYSAEQLKEFVTPNTLIRKSGTSKWTKSIIIEELKDFFEHPDSPAIKDWFYTDLDDKETGPYSKPEIENLIKNKIITAEMRIRHLNWNRYEIVGTTKLYKDIIEYSQKSENETKTTYNTKHFFSFKNLRSKSAQKYLIGLLIFLWIIIFFLVHKQFSNYKTQISIAPPVFLPEITDYNNLPTANNNIIPAVITNAEPIKKINRAEFFIKPAPLINLNTPNFFVYMLDVGQGDAFLIRTPTGKNYMIDAATNSRSVIIPYLTKLGITEIDIMILSHPHHDHIGGAADIIRNFKVHKVYDSGYPHTSSSYKKILELIKEKNIEYRIPKPGETLLLENDLKLEFFHPDKSDYRNINDNSIICKFTYGKNSILFTGDAEHPANAVVLSKFKDKLKSDILKLGHHGSRTSTEPKWLEAVNPDIALISCGFANHYKHPNKEVLTLLENKNIKIFRTDLDGFVIFESDGKKWNSYIDKMPLYDIVSQPFNIQTNYSLKFENLDFINSDLWIKKGIEDQFELTDNALVIAAKPGEQIYNNQFSCPALLKLPPRADKWTSIIKMVGSQSRNTDGAILFFNNETNWLSLSSSAEGKTISLTNSFNGKHKTDYFRLKFSPSYFAIERYDDKLFFAVSENRIDWTIIKRYNAEDISFDFNSGKIGLAANAWRSENSLAWFLEYDEY